MKKSINRNILWAEFFVDSLLNFEVKNVVICPGSRNTSLIFAFSKEKKFKKFTVIDERTAGFFALGIAKKICQPVAVVTTSGTAVANLYPAVIEAYYSNIPLILCTADRPEILHDCGANQTINQKDIFTKNVKDFLNIPADSISKKTFKNIYSSLYQKFYSQKFDPGPIQINLMFSKPFEPNNFTDLIDSSTLKFIKSLSTKVLEPSVQKTKSTDGYLSLINIIDDAKSGLIIAGQGVDKSEADFLVKLSRKIQFPIFIDASSEMFFSSSDDNILNSFNLLAFSKEFKKIFQPEVIVQFGKTPTSNNVLQFFESSKAFKIGINKQGNLYDPSRSTKMIFKSNAKEFIENILPLLTTKRNKEYERLFYSDKSIAQYCSKLLDETDWFFEAKVYYELLKYIPENSNLFIGNSLPIRDFDTYVQRDKRKINLYNNRGASGIDGVVSTAIGIASKSRATFLVLGDQSFYHDLNSLLIAVHHKIHLTIIIVNNNCGGIFKMLPAAKYKTELRKYLSLNYHLEFENIIKSFGANYYRIESWNHFAKTLKKIKPNQLNVLEIRTDSDRSAKFRKSILIKTDKILASM